MIDILIIALAAWRIGYLITDDKIFQPIKHKTTNILDKWVTNKPINNKGYTTKRVYIADNIDYLLDCIYCITFWTTLAVFFLPNIIQQFLAVWATATLVGTTHNQLTKNNNRNKID